MAGFALIIISLIAASFTNRVDQLIATQGALYGIGGALLYNPFIFYLDEWFIARKGMAFGIMWAGTGLGGTVVPLIMDWSLNKYGFRTTLRMWAVTFVSFMRMTCRPNSHLPIVHFDRPLDLPHQTPVTSTTKRHTATPEPRLFQNRSILVAANRKHHRRNGVLHAFHLPTRLVPYPCPSSSNTSYIFIRPIKII